MFVACERAPDKYSVIFTTTVNRGTGSFTVGMLPICMPLASLVALNGDTHV